MSATAAPETGFSLSRAFHGAVGYVVDTLKQAGALVYDFVKANPVVSAVGADLLLTGGALTQQAIVAVAKTAAGAVGEIGLSAGEGLWNMIFGGSSAPTAPALGGGGGW